jgi:hypothetical protein
VAIKRFFVVRHILSGHGADLTIIGASDAYLQSVQRTEEDMLGANVFEIFPEGHTATEIHLAQGCFYFLHQSTRTLLN